MAIFPVLSKALLARSLPLTTTLVLLLIAGASPAQAQVTPDATLGNEASTVTPDALVRGSEADLIEGGALRGSNLFHSFLEFNVDAGQRLYFANPAGVESILSRITGNNPSAIFGTLGVDGAADLFLINPNGLVFGETATLDIQGSFYASTAAAIPMGDGVYSATAPEQSSLLTVNPSALFSNYLSESSGNIESQASLAVGENLTLAANQLDLQRQVAAGSNLTLLGNTIQIRDAVDAPFVGFAGGNLLVQGNEQVDIVALSHPDSGLYSYGDMVLRSQNPVGGDAHYWSGGNFRVETLNGSGGSLFSPIDPIIRSLGDVSIETYLGSSLHILAGGAVTIGTAAITAPDPGALEIDFLQEAITLSDSTVVQVDGGVQPTLDVRAGVQQEALGTPPIGLLTGFDPNIDVFFGSGFSTDIPSSADIIIGDVLIAAPNGLVLLTNQYQPNLNLNEGNITITGNGFYGRGIDASGLNGQGGVVYLDARSDISVINSYIATSALEDVGDTVINAGGTVWLDGRNGSRLAGVFTDLAPGGEGSGGNIRINADNLEVLNGARINALVFGVGQGGDLTFNIRNTARFVGSSPTNSGASGAFIGVELNGQGQSGNANINARTLEIIDGAQLGAGTFGQGDAGNVNLEIEELARFSGFNSTNGNPSGIFSTVEINGEGQGGSIQISARNLEVLNGAQLGAGTFGVGNAGSVILMIGGLARFAGFNSFNGGLSGAFSNILPDGIGEGGNVQISAQDLEVVNGAQLVANSSGLGNAGSVILKIENSASFVGFQPLNGNSSGAFSNIELNGIGRGGNIQIEARNLEVVDGAQLGAGISGQGNAGSVILAVEELVRFSGANSTNGNPSGAFSNIAFGGEGQGGNIKISAQNLEVLSGAQLVTGTVGLGNAGSVILEIDELARFVGFNTFNNSFSSGAFSNIAPNAEGQGGDIQVSARNLEVLDGAQLFTGVSGAGNAGDVILEVGELARFAGFNPFNGGLSGAFSNILPDGKGQGGNVQISAQDLEVTDGARLTANSSGLGDAGNVNLEIENLARFVGYSPLTGDSSGAFSNLGLNGVGKGGNIQISAHNLEVLEGAQLGAGTFGLGDAGSVFLEIEDLARFVGFNPITGFSAGAFSNVQPAGQGIGGNIQISSRRLEVVQRAALAANSLGIGDAGNLILNITDSLFADDADIVTSTESASGGQVTIQAGNIILRNNSDIQTFVGQGEGGGGNITIASNFLIALEDSDILAFSADGRGGIIDLSRTTFFGQNPSIAARNLSLSELLDLDGNDRVDINATGGIESGQIFVGDATFVENSLTALTDALVDTSALTAGSCIARSQDSLGSFVVTGRDGLPSTPGDGGISAYPTGTVRSLDEPTATSLQEPDGVYQLPDGRLVLGRACD